ncbi:hypothetical protein DY000_02042851 [Brassica cretica]|uniref:Fatty acid desaturase domain-containing protein n=1 Tax=Brassica cretica TaxID=69181 RepID=A0ABQ7BLE3_BRACR|nr:hypothetical protein DY000_02042851 [Brassica cretica]
MQGAVAEEETVVAVDSDLVSLPKCLDENEDDGGLASVLKVVKEARCEFLKEIVPSSLPSLESAVYHMWVPALAFGEGWHNNHHAFEFSEKHGLEWLQLDMNWYVVSFLQAIGLATDVKLHSETHKQRMALNSE